MKYKAFSLIVAIGLCSMSILAQETGSVTDSRDGKIYKTVVIGSQTWSSENLDAITFSNGDTIPQARTIEEWMKAGSQGKPAWCLFDNSTTIGEKYGKLYNWYAVNDPRGLAPKGTHIPDDADWTKLTNFLIGGTTEKKAKSSKEIVAKGSNIKKSGFDGLPGGYRSEMGLFNDFGFDGGWWSATESSEEDAWGRGLYYLYGNVFRYDLSAQYCYYNKEFGLSVRFIVD
jgi:uncharacterized protein (TIGR02145 family)